MRIVFWVAVGACVVPSAAVETAPPVLLPAGPALESFLNRSDMVWSFSTNETATLPLLWTEGPFVGNGMVGALFTVEPSADAGLAIKVEVSRAV